MIKNVLYLSCHAILEYDECKLLSELGYNVRAVGSYMNPHSPGDPKRPPIMSMEVNHQHISLSNRFHQDKLQQETLDWADVIIFMHMPSEWITPQIDTLRASGKHIIYRGIGQSQEAIEIVLNNLQIQLGDKFHVVKYSDRELLWPSNAGAEAIIPFYKDIPYTWEWNPQVNTDILFVTQSARKRGNHCHFAEIELATRSFPSRLLLGPSNEDETTIDTACPDYDGLIRAYETSNVMVYSGTVPASYTLSPLEAIMVGTPMLTISKAWYRREHMHWIPENLFEVPDWFPEQVVYNEDDLVDTLRVILNEPDLLREMSANQRIFANKHFSKEVVAPKWDAFLKSL